MKEDEGVFKETGEELLRKATKLCEKEGRKGWKFAQETMLKEKTSSSELEEAIKFVMLKYKPDYFRPALLSLCSRAVGATSDATISTAASLILFGRAIGIHDDIIDQSKSKNQNPTILGRFGKDLSLILSDVLLFNGFTLFKKTIQSGVPLEKIIAILDIIKKIWFEQSEGEILELRFRGQVRTTPQDCLAKIRMRASELEAITSIGGILGGGSEGEVRVLGRFGRLLGTMSILRDEVIDMLEFDVLRHRIQRESLPLPLVYALQNHKVRGNITLMFSKRRLTTMDLKKISKIVNDAGGLIYVSKLISKMAGKACSYVDVFKDKNKELKLITNSIKIDPNDWKHLFQTSVPSSKMVSLEP